ncbi:GDSL-type esterase/lipase family protein [Nocardia carnea]|uniref:GDSL-type esterase/lipase family protein n=1 Tax=Nocardia carnea TaxID=37328 RepID=UPI0024546526|nr:GDSL-type esterase/lipase family protein [Nocardia carnea]
MHCDAEWATTAITADIVRGAFELEHTERGILPHRLPAWARAQGDGQLAMAESQPSGVRLVFGTSATTIELDTVATRLGYAGAPRRPAGIYDLRIDGRLAAQAHAPGGDTVTIDMATGNTTRQPGPVGTVRFADLPAGFKNVEIWLPHNEVTELAGLRTDAAVEPVPGGGRGVWLQYGSSISQGSNAGSPSTTWPALAAARGDVELTNMGLSGSAMLDPFAARAIRDTRADLISLEIGINLVNADVMRMRAFGPAVHGFLSTIREGHPTTPLLVISPIYCEIHEHTPGPGAFDLEALGAGEMRFLATGDPAEQANGKLTLTSVREELSRIVTQRAANDPHLFYLDGRELYGETDYRENPLPDRLHPDAATHHLIGERFAERVFTADGAFGDRPGSVHRPAVAARV